MERAAAAARSVGSEVLGIGWAVAWKRRAAAASAGPLGRPGVRAATSLAAQAAQARAQRSISYGVNFLLAALHHFPRRTAGIGAWNHLQKTASMLPASVLRLAAR